MDFIFKYSKINFIFKANEKLSKYVMDTKLKQLGFPNWIVNDSDSKPSKFDHQLRYKSIPATLLSRQLRLQHKIDLFSIKVDHFRSLLIKISE